MSDPCDASRDMFTYKYLQANYDRVLKVWFFHFSKLREIRKATSYSYLSYEWLNTFSVYAAIIVRSLQQTEPHNGLAEALRRISFPSTTHYRLQELGDCENMYIICR